MGTPDFAVPSLKKLFESNHKIAAVVTAPDKARGRGKKVSVTPVKEFALKNNIPILQPEKLKDEKFIEALKNFPADLFVIVAFRILPEEVFSLPGFGSFNLHASLLPKYRGAAPIQWAIIKGETETGVTTFKLAGKVDTGNVYIQRKINITPEDDFGSLHDKLSLLGADVVLQTVELIESESYKLLPQDDSLATPAPKINKETGRINWQTPAVEILNLVRGLSPSPAAFFIFDEKPFKIYKASVNKNVNLKPGEIKQNIGELIIGCGEDALSILEIQQEGRKRMDTASFLRGFNFNKN